MKPNSKSAVRQKSSLAYQALTAIAIVSLLSLSTGCSTLMLNSNKSHTPIATDSSQGTYLVKMSGGFSKDSVYQGAIDQTTTVQSVLEASGAIKQYRNMEVTVQRVVKESGRPLKMVIRYDASKKSVAPEQNYSIHPGDQIIVESVASSFAEKMINSIGQ